MPNRKEIFRRNLEKGRGRGAGLQQKCALYAKVRYFSSAFFVLRSGLARGARTSPARSQRPPRLAPAEQTPPPLWPLMGVLRSGATGLIGEWRNAWNSTDCCQLPTRRRRPASHSRPPCRTKHSAGNGSEPASTSSRRRSARSLSSDRVKWRRKRCVGQPALSLLRGRGAVGTLAYRPTLVASKLPPARTRASRSSSQEDSTARAPPRLDRLRQPPCPALLFHFKRRVPGEAPGKRRIHFAPESSVQFKSRSARKDRPVIDPT